jgi:hypothetical protein
VSRVLDYLKSQKTKRENKDPMDLMDKDLVDRLPTEVVGLVDLHPMEVVDLVGLLNSRSGYDSHIDDLMDTILGLIGGLQ